MPTAGLIAILRSPQSISQLTDSDWNEIIAQGRKTWLLGQVAASLERAQLLGPVSVAVQRHLALARRTAVRRNESVAWETVTLRRAVDPAIPLVLLKGCAYVACADDNAAGRIFSDMDVLVRRQDLPGVEADLVSVGWKPGQVSGYDSAYYRNWMHEVPPMEHVRRHTVLDVHHAINPPVSRFYVNPDQLFARMVELRPGLFVLSATDRVIHCALHLLQEGEPRKLMRDLYDLHVLLRQHHGSAARMEQLRRRASELQVDALTQAAVGAASALFADRPIQVARSGWLQACVERSARETQGKSTLAGELAGIALLSYSHWMKMPLHLLLPHLTRKSFLRMTSGKNSRLAQT